MDATRTSERLTLGWRFHRGDAPEAWQRGFDETGWRTVSVPHDWAVEEPFSREHSSGTGYLPAGTGWYRRAVRLPAEWKGRRVTVTFDGVYNNAQVWFNGNYLGRRPYGYSAFSYDLTDFADFGSDRNVLSVRVDHRHAADSRWYTGSGIYRDVVLETTGPVRVAPYGVFATTPHVDRRRADVQVDVRVLADDGPTSPASSASPASPVSPVALTVRCTLRDSSGRTLAAAERPCVASAGVEGAARLDLAVADPPLWSPESPTLLELATEVLRDGVAVDLVRTSVGLRWFSFDPAEGFFLNGENRKFKGVCLHHDAGCLGAAVPARVWAHRLRELKEMGCDAIRCGHNPPSTVLLDLCDRLGFLVMDEAFDEWEGVKNKWAFGHNVNPPSHYGYYEDFPDWSERDLKTMVLRDRNHPSVILWSIGNEIDYPNDPYAHPLFAKAVGNNDAGKSEKALLYDPDRPNAERLVTTARRLVRWVKEVDATRPVTAALAFPELSTRIGLADALDVVGYNYKEPLYEEDRRRFPDRVLYGSENSTMPDAWRYVRERRDICGQFLWTGIDYLGEAHGWPMRVAQAGLLDTAGFRKPRFYQRQALWSAEPLARLVSRRRDDPRFAGHPAWNAGEPLWEGRPGETLEVLCYTNLDEAELTLAGRSLGTRRRTGPEQALSWDVPFEPGTLRVVARGDAGATATHELSTAQAARRITLAAEGDGLVADGADTMRVEISVVDAEGRPVPTADLPVTVAVEGPGVLAGLENGDPQDLDPYASPTRRARYGRLVAYVRTTGEAGRIAVRAVAPGLEAENLAIDSRM